MILFIIIVLFICVVSIIIQLDSSLFITQIDTPPNDPDDNTAVIAGVVAAVVLAILVVVFIIVFKR